ncbi:hypothetical protein VFPPC_17394 [Pochonia chlamydosporia 170]|uniref:Uncharacterized protein n=1 Tax=Pochonia chlamydosporia 170 TaxID=1380566 RepID=A0A219ARS0_METCM|nr:hypothetical protein VFPPC_17394 [Pochonia chlamydosporia 170]OWT43457.1 hypothetical protein VFPPC_17394 [Pochonia chlamydosporia 170]
MKRQKARAGCGSWERWQGPQGASEAPSLDSRTTSSLFTTSIWPTDSLQTACGGRKWNEHNSAHLHPHTHITACDHNANTEHYGVRRTPGANLSDLHPRRLSQPGPSRYYSMAYGPMRKHGVSWAISRLHSW